MVFFFGTPPHFFILVIKSYLQNKKKIEKSLGGATGPQSFVHKVNGIFGQNFQTVISGPKKSTRLAKLK